MNPNEMIDRYVNEVGQRLPRKTRADIEMELRSLLWDMLEERSGGDPTAQITAELLREFGHPEAIAAQYRPTEFLIGPKLFPTYKAVTTLAIAIIAGLHLLWFCFVLWQEGTADSVGQLLDFIFSFGRVAIWNVAIVTVVFAIIERSGLDLSDWQEEAKEWDPMALPPVTDSDRINRPEFAVGLFFTVFLLFWLNVLANRSGRAEAGQEVAWLIYLAAPAFVQQIPWLTASLLVEGLLKTAVLLQGRWHRLTYGLEVASLSFSLYVAYRIYRLEEISTVSVFTYAIKITLAIIMLVVLIEIVRKAIKLLRGQPPTASTSVKSKLA